MSSSERLKNKVSRLIFNPYCVPIKISNKEILISTGSLSKNFYIIDDDDPRKIDKLLEIFNHLQKQPLPYNELEKLLKGVSEASLLHDLIDAGIIIDEEIHPITAFFIKNGNFERSLFDKVVLVHDEGKLSKFVYESIKETFNDLEVNTVEVRNIISTKSSYEDVLYLVILDHWKPHLLRNINKIFLEKEATYMTVFSSIDSCFIGPLVVNGKGACYQCMEYQMNLSFRNHIAYISLREYLSGSERYIPSPPNLFLKFSGNFASILASLVLIGDFHRLMNKCVVIDLRSIFISSTVINKNPLCVCSKGQPTYEV